MVKSRSYSGGAAVRADCRLGSIPWGVAQSTDWGLWFCLNYGSEKVGRTLTGGLRPEPDLEGVDCSDRLQIMVSYNRLSEISTIRFGACIA